MTYWPVSDDTWETISADEAGFQRGALADAIGFAEAHDSSWPRDLDNTKFLPTLTADEPEPWNEIIGPIVARGGPAGLLLKGGRIAAHWGNPGRADMTFSIAKSYLAILAGLAVSEGLIRDLDDPVGDYVPGGLFSSAQNSAITWRHLLTQTSEWQGTLFGKPDQVDHYRVLGAGTDNSRKGELRPLQTPGTYWEYNDVRVNVLSLALLHVFRRPLPEVLHDAIMDPIGADPDWDWWGYRNSTVTIEGQEMISVPGGTHWGGGMRINSYNHARFGLLIARDGVWQGRSLLPADWIKTLQTPCPMNPAYGFLWWLNGLRSHYPSAPATSFFAMGAGTNLIWIDQTLDIVMVARWIDQDHVDDLIGAFMAALR